MRIIRKKNAGSCGFNENVRFKNINDCTCHVFFYIPCVERIYIVSRSMSYLCLHVLLSGKNGQCVMLNAFYCFAAISSD